MRRVLPALLLLLTVLASPRLGASLYHYDGRGDVVALTGNTGNVTYAAEYNAFGTHATSLNVTTNVTTTGTQEVGTDTDPFRTNTREEFVDADGNGWVNEGHRPRDLNTDTYLSPDPLGFAGGSNNFYNYVNDNPWTKFDPEGEFVGEIIDAGFFAWDTVSYGYYAATGQHGKAALAATNVGIDLVGAAVDVGDAGTGGGTTAIVLARSAAKAKMALQAASAVGHTIQAGQQTNAAVNADKADPGGGKPSGDATDSKPPEQKPEESAKTDKDKAADSSGSGADQSPSKRFSKEKEALVDMAQKDKKTGMTSGDMQAYKDLNSELDDPFKDGQVHGPEKHPNRPAPTSQQLHGHVGPVDHIPIKDDPAPADPASTGTQK
jgi:RHS repeat-associated protein